MEGLLNFNGSENKLFTAQMDVKLDKTVCGCVCACSMCKAVHLSVTGVMGSSFLLVKEKRGGKWKQLSVVCMRACMCVCTHTRVSLTCVHLHVSAGVLPHCHTNCWEPVCRSLP